MANQLLQFAGSLAAIAVIVTLAHYLGFSRVAHLDSEEEAADLLRLAAGGFEPKHVCLDRSGQGALAQDDMQALAILKPHGNHFVARRLGAETQLTAEGKSIHIADPSLGSTPVVLRFDNSFADWVADLVDAK